MVEYIEKAAILSKCEDMWNSADETTQTGVDTINTIDKITDFIEAMPVADVQPASVIKELQEHIKQRILETAFNNGGIYGEVAEDIADRIDIWVDEFGRTKND